MPRQHLFQTSKLTRRREGENISFYSFPVIGVYMPRQHDSLKTNMRLTSSIMVFAPPSKPSARPDQRAAVEMVTMIPSSRFSPVKKHPQLDERALY
jgi:hypothetical protein